MSTLIMPLGTAVWLIENTSLSFKQIADFCGLHELEIGALADEYDSSGMRGVDPVAMGQLTKEEIDRCSADPESSLRMATPKVVINTPKKKGRKYTPLLKRRDRPDAIAWMIKNYPELTDAVICSFLSTTKNTVKSIRNKTHARMSEIRPRDPVILGFSSQIELDKLIEKHKKSSEN